MKLLRLFAVLVICFCTSNLDAKIYIWTDKSGVKHYSNTPPPKDAEVIEERKESESDETTVNQESQELDETGDTQSEEPEEQANDAGISNIALRSAASSGNLEEVERLLGEGADINGSADNG